MAWPRTGIQMDDTKMRQSHLTAKDPQTRDPCLFMDPWATETERREVKNKKVLSQSYVLSEVPDRQGSFLTEKPGLGT
jgi:hypothetical protein